MGERIRQCYIPENMKKSFSYFFEKYSLDYYKDREKPSLFFSGWSCSPIKKHKSLGVVIWRGTDITNDKILSLKNKKYIYHIAVSSFIKEDLKNQNIKYKFIPVVGRDMSIFIPTLLGNEIYAYAPYNDNLKYFKRYGMDIIKKIQKKIRYKINIIKYSNKYSRKEMKEIYNLCFCGLRLTEHDGIPSQVIEMGLMGRKSFYNGGIPGSIKWNKKDIDSIVEGIKEEAKKIGTIDYDYSDKIKNFINIGDNWLNVRNWI